MNITIVEPHAETLYEALGISGSRSKELMYFVDDMFTYTPQLKTVESMKMVGVNCETMEEFAFSLFYLVSKYQFKKLFSNLKP